MHTPSTNSNSLIKRDNLSAHPITTTERYDNQKLEAAMGPEKYGAGPWLSLLAELPSLHMADGEPTLNSVVQHLEQAPRVGIEIAQDGELVAFLPLGHALSPIQGVTCRHERRSELEPVLDAVDVLRQ
jgi:hypothetical protein